MRFLLPLVSVFILSACLDNESPETPTKSHISKTNAKNIVATSFSAFNQLEMVEDFTDSTHMKAQMSAVNKTLAILYCGEDPGVDTGHGSLDINLTGNFITVLNLSVIFSQCDVTESVTIDGGYALDFEGDGPIGPQHGDGSNQITQTFDQLSIIDSAEDNDTLIDGTVTASHSYSAPLFTWLENVNLTLIHNQNELTFNDWQKRIDFDTETSQLSLNISGDFSASDENGGFSFVMIEPLIFEATANGAYFDASFVVSGKFKITADDNSSVTVTIIDATEALLEIDEDGDGTIDFEIIVLISELALFDALDD